MGLWDFETRLLCALLQVHLPETLYLATVRVSSSSAHTDQHTLVVRVASYVLYRRNSCQRHFTLPP